MNAQTNLATAPDQVSSSLKNYMVFADGTGKGAVWGWAAVKAVPMPEEEKVKFKEKGKDYEWKMDMSTMMHFNERDFIEALTYINVLPE